MMFERRYGLYSIKTATAEMDQLSNSFLFVNLIEHG